MCGGGQSCINNVCSISTPTPTGAGGTFAVSGNVYTDTDKNGMKCVGGFNHDGTTCSTDESNYTASTLTLTVCAGTQTSCATPVTTINTAADGSYNSGGILASGQYTVSLSLPTSGGYQPTSPSGAPPAWAIIVGSPCSVGGSRDASCDGSNNVTNLDFGLTDQAAWIQSTGSDIRIDSGVNDPIPAGATCGSFASTNGSGNTPGIIYSGNGSASFGSGQPNPNNWVVGGLSHPETFSPVSPNVIRTSYSYISSVLIQNGTTATDISGYCGSGGLGNCQLSGSLPNGVYKANSSLTLTGSGYNFPTGKNYIILVNGDLNINENILVPNGSTAFFTASGNINVASSVGQASSTNVCNPPTTANAYSTGCNIEGYYSADGDFVVQGSNTCPTPDSRLNVAGAIVVNASLSPSNPGSFINNRDLCIGDRDCPVFSITERPDFILNSPYLLLNTRRIFQELAP